MISFRNRQKKSIARSGIVDEVEVEASRSLWPRLWKIHSIVTALSPLLLYKVDYMIFYL